MIVIVQNGPQEQGVPPGSDLMRERRQLINVAYRLLGSLAEAEDAVQEAYARWYSMSDADREQIKSPGAWLTKVTSRICLDVLGSARSRRERYVGPWVPEPLPEPSEWGRPGLHADATGDPADRVTLDESINMAFLVVLESMTPAERVAFILHDVFHFPFIEIAEITGRTAGACRQLAFSARRRIDAERPVTTPAAEHTRVVRDFKRAWEAMDIDALIGLLDPEATAIGDGGGIVRAALEPVRGRERIAALYVGFLRLAGDATLLERTVNGQLGLVGQVGGRPVSVFAFDVNDGLIKTIWGIRNPEKLRTWRGSGSELRERFS